MYSPFYQRENVFGLIVKPSSPRLNSFISEFLSFSMIKETLARKNAHVLFGPIPQKLTNKKILSIHFITI